MNPQSVALSVSPPEVMDSRLDRSNNSRTSNDADRSSESFSSGDGLEDNTTPAVACRVRHRRIANRRPSRMGDAELVELRQIYDTPSDVILHLPKPGECPTSLPRGEIAVNSSQFRAGLKFPLHPFLRWMLTQLGARERVSYFYLYILSMETSIPRIPLSYCHPASYTHKAQPWFQ